MKTLWNRLMCSVGQHAWEWSEMDDYGCWTKTCAHCHAEEGYSHWDSICG